MMSSAKQLDCKSQNKAYSLRLKQTSREHTRTISALLGEAADVMVNWDKPNELLNTDIRDSSLYYLYKWSKDQEVKSGAAVIFGEDRSSLFSLQTNLMFALCL